ncbi:hypothetical protein [Pedobacter sp. NJ-S-72]
MDEHKINKIVAGHYKDFGEELHLPKYFSLNESDNFLVFNRNNKVDLDMFIKCIRNKKSITLKEYVLPECADVHDMKGRPYASQHIVCVVNKSKSYPSPQPMGNVIGDIKKLKVKRTFVPGDEWLYIKLYAHYSLTDCILINVILPVLQKYKKNSPGFKCFF